jgi:UDP-glucuronate 4-epimerase
MNILVTGAAGFIGFHVCTQLLQRGDTVVGIDNLNSYYSPALKRARLALLEQFANFSFHLGDICDQQTVEAVFSAHSFNGVIHLAAQAGVRHSLENPALYVQSNVVGFGHLLEQCRQQQPEHLVFASSSSVYGLNSDTPYSPHRGADHPISLYAATKRSNELMAHSYAHLYGLPTTGLRFFTVYGPWGRPDMAIFLFARAIMRGEALSVFNHGNMMRDFTYIDDIVTGVIRTLDHPACADTQWSAAEPDPASSSAPYRLYNIGNNQPVKLMDFIQCLEKSLGKPAVLEFREMQAGDVQNTCADVNDLVAAIDYQPNTPIAEGVAQFARWYLQHHQQFDL